MQIRQHIEGLSATAADMKLRILSGHVNHLYLSPEPFFKLRFLYIPSQVMTAHSKEFDLSSDQTVHPSNFPLFFCRNQNLPALASVTVNFKDVCNEHAQGDIWLTKWCNTNWTKLILWKLHCSYPCTSNIVLTIVEWHYVHSPQPSFRCNSLQLFTNTVHLVFLLAPVLVLV